MCVCVGLVFHALHENIYLRVRSRRLVLVVRTRAWRIVAASAWSARVALYGVQVRLYFFVIEYGEWHVFANDAERTVLKKKNGGN